MKSAEKNTPFYDIGDRLRFYREEYAGLNQQQFAEKAGLARSTYVSWETGNARASLTGALALRETYGLPLDFLYCGNADILSQQLRTTWLSKL